MRTLHTNSVPQNICVIKIHTEILTEETETYHTHAHRTHTILLHQFPNYLFFSRWSFCCCCCFSRTKQIIKRKANWISFPIFIQNSMHANARKLHPDLIECNECTGEMCIYLYIVVVSKTAHAKFMICLSEKYACLHQCLTMAAAAAAAASHNSIFASSNRMNFNWRVR